MYKEHFLYIFLFLAILKFNLINVQNTAHSIIPINMTLNNVNVKGFNFAKNFAGFFDKKVSDIVNATIINPRVY